MTQITQAARLTHQTRRTNGTVISRFIQAYAGWQQRKRLATLDDAALRDIGLNRTQANAEAARPIWNAPAQWLR